MSEDVHDALSVRDDDGTWFDSDSADLQEAARQFAAYKGWSPGSWSASRLPSPDVPLGRKSLAVAFRRFRTYQAAYGRSNRSRIEIQAISEGFIVPPA